MSEPIHPAEQQFFAAQVAGRGRYHAWRPGWAAALCGRQPREHETWTPAVGEGITCKRCLDQLRERARRQVRDWQDGL